MIQKLDDQLEKRYNRPNDNWVEVPVQTIDENGELKTVTRRKRSLRKKRQIFTLSCTAFTLGSLMILMSSPYSKEFLVPGGLSSNHGQILAGQGADRCAACHGAADGSLASWISSTILIGKAEGLTQSELCMKCHDESFAMDTSLNPHNVAPAELAELSNQSESAFFDAKMAFAPPVHGNKIACSACHREHHGADHDLKYMTDKQCQSCHKNSFHSFETDHPEFVSYPLKRRSRISFDHTTHFGKHFPLKNKEFDCKQCHTNDSFKNVKQTASFEQSCAECHNQKILNSGDQELALVALPMIDTDAIEAAKLNVGTWPLAATGDFDGQIPPIMRVLLTADSQAAEILGRYGADFDFSDINPEDSAQVNDAVELVWAIKRLMYDLALNGPQAVKTRIESVLELEVSIDELQNMITNLDEPVFQTAVRTWLPNLSVEIATNRLGSAAISRTVPDKIRQLEIDQSNIEPTEFENGKVERVTAQWWPSEQTLLLSLKSQQLPSNSTDNEEDLLAVNPLKGLMKISEDEVALGASAKSTLGNESQADSQPTTNTPSSSASNEIVESSNQSKPTTPAVISLNQNTDVSGDPELLAVNPLQSKGGTLEMQVLNQATQPELTNSSATRPAQPKTNRHMIADSNVFPSSDKPRLVVPSGWFRNDDLFQISYRPSGHSDDCIQSWIELVARASESDTRPETKRLFEKTLSMTSVGLCRTCHTVDQMPDKTFKINWRSEYRDASVRSFTRFSHAPHLIQPNLQDCSHCHSLDMNASNAESFLGVNSKITMSNFLPIEKANCTSCHQKNQTPNGCTQCHNYHVGSKVSGFK